MLAFPVQGWGIRGAPPVLASLRPPNPGGVALRGRSRMEVTNGA
jgi:hypothetical protein